MTETEQKQSFYDKAISYWNSLGDYQYFVWAFMALAIILITIIAISVRNSRKKALEAAKLELENLEDEWSELSQTRGNNAVVGLITYLVLGYMVLRLLTNKHVMHADNTDAQKAAVKDASEGFKVYMHNKIAEDTAKNSLSDKNVNAKTGKENFSALMKSLKKELNGIAKTELNPAPAPTMLSASGNNDADNHSAAQGQPAPAAAPVNKIEQKLANLNKGDIIKNVYKLEDKEPKNLFHLLNLKEADQQAYFIKHADQISKDLKLIDQNSKNLKIKDPLVKKSLALTKDFTEKRDADIAKFDKSQNTHISDRENGLLNPNLNYDSKDNYVVTKQEDIFSMPTSLSSIGMDLVGIMFAPSSLIIWLVDVAWPHVQPTVDLEISDAEKYLNYVLNSKDASNNPQEPNNNSK